MRSRSLFSALTATLVVAMMAVAAPAAAQDADPRPDGTVFVATIENVSTPETLPTSTGSVAVPLSPGAYVVHKAGRNPLVEPRNAASTALESLAEDGDPSGFPALIKGAKVFNTPVGASAPGPLLPGGKYQFEFVAKPGYELSLATMFVQSNDWFYSTVLDTKSIALFDMAGQPLAQDASNQLKLWESKTEVDEEPGTGANQAPRQSGPNTGPSESGQVISLSSQGKSVKLNGPVIKLTIAPKGVTVPDEPDTPDEPGDERPGEPFDAADGMVVGRTGTLNGLNGINVGPDGKVYNASVGGSEITVHDPETGQILDRIGADQGVGGPDDLFITSDGTIYWTEILAGNVGRLDPDGTLKKQFVGPGVNPITMSDDGRLFVARIFLGDGLYELDPELEADPIPLLPDIVGLNGFDFGPDGLLYAPLFFGGEVVKIDVDAASPTPETVTTGLMVPSAVAFNSAGELHASELAGGKILKIDASTGDVEVLAQIDGTIDNLAFDANDRLFFAAGADNQIVRLTPDGEIDVFGEIALGLPGGVAISPDGTAWVGDLFVMRGYRDGADPAVSYYERSAPPGTAFGGANTVFAYGDLLVTSTTFGNNVQVLNPATGEVLEDFRNLASPTNAIIHNDLLVASQLGATPGSSGSVVDARSGDVLIDGLALPVGLASDGDTLYVSDWATGMVTAVTDSGSTVIADGLAGPEGLAVDGDRLLVVQEGLDQVSAIDLDSGDVSPVITGLDLGPPPLEGFAPFGSVTGVAVGPDGAIYVTQDNETNALLKFVRSDPTEPPAAPSVLEALAADGRFTTLLEVISVSEIQPPPPGVLFTFMAPTDEAFAAVPPEVLEGLLADPGALLDILLYHIAEGSFSAEQLAGVDQISTLQGGTIGVEVVDGKVVLNGDVTVIDADIPMAEGIIHAIDGVLSPPEQLAFLVSDFGRGSMEVPGPGDPAALTEAVMVINAAAGPTDEVCFFVITTVEDSTVAHIHRGAPGESGPVVIDTGFSAESWEPDEFFPRNRIAEDCVQADDALVAELIAAPGDFYFNVHSERFPAGATREQIFDAEGLDQQDFRIFTAAPLLGSNEVPDPGDPDSARGFVDFFGPTDVAGPITPNGEICYTSVALNVAEINAGHIHTGVAGQAGDVLVDLEMGSTWPVDISSGGLNWFTRGCVAVPEDVLAQITADPAGYYVNLHNAEFPAGAVRAQLVEGIGEVLLISEMVPPEGSDVEGNGFADPVFFASQELICWGTDATGVGEPTGLYIAGPDGVVVDFDFTNYPFQDNLLPFIDVSSYGCQEVDAATIETIVANPGDYTFNVDTANASPALSGPLFDPFVGPDGPPPPPEPPELVDLGETLVADGRFTTLLAAIEASDLDPPPPGQDFTLLAPTDDAFAALPEGALDGLLADPQALTDILLYHLIEGTVPAETVVTLTEAMSLLGPSIDIEVVDGTVVLNGDVNVVETDLFATNGVIHAIDGILQPPEREFLAILVADFARGSTEVPGPGDPNSLSVAFTEVFELDGGVIEMCIGANTSIAAPTVAHIHRGAAGVSGPVVVDTGFTADSWEPDEFLPRDQFANDCVEVEAALAQEIIGSPGDFYFNIHSDEFPDGANREQLFDAEGLNEFPRAFTAAPLLGSNEVPGPGDPDSGRGFVDFSLPTTANGELCYISVVFNVGEITGAHIHAGVAGESGDVVTSLEAGSRWPVVEEPSGLGWIIQGCAPIAADTLSQIQADPSAFYANLHNTEYPAGAVRAQLVNGVGETIRLAELSPPEGAEPTEEERSGFINLALFPDQGQLCWGSDSSGIGTPTGLSLINGDETLALDLGIHPFADNALPFAELTSFGCQSAESEFIQSIVDNPAAFTAQIDSATASPGLVGDLFDPSVGPPPPPPEGVELQILAINDFHGNIATTSSAFGGVGRADFLAANMATAEAEAENSIIVSAGDLIGASPLISALFHDEPTIEAMNLIGLEINGVGNHEFDEGADELLRMQNGGTHPVDGNLDGDGFNGADFEFLAANVVDDATGETIFAPYTVKTYEGIDVAFIGMTLEGTPTIVTPAGVAGLTFNDEIDTVNALIPELQADGIEAIVVLLHEGGIASEGGGDGDGCGTLSGPLNDIVVGLDDAVDLVIGGHNNQRFTCMDVDGKAVTMAYWAGRMFTDIDVVLDTDTGDMTVVAIDNKENFQDGVTPAADVTALIDRYDALSAPLANRVIGSITGDILRTANAAGESPLGDVIADAQLATTQSDATGGAVIAFMNPGGIRSDILAADVAGGEDPGEVTYGEAFTVQPFGNSLVTMTLTGTQIHTLLTQQWVGQESPRILQVSEGFSYTWDASAADDVKVDPASMMLNGSVIDPGANYRVTVNSFLADGGDNFAVLVDGTDRLGGDVDLDAFEAYFSANTPVAPGPADRITTVGTAPASAKVGR